MKKKIGSINQLHDNHVIRSDFMRSSIGNGALAKFWIDVWCGGLILKDHFHKLFALSSLKNAYVCDFSSGNGWRFD